MDFIFDAPKNAWKSMISTVEGIAKESPTFASG